MIPPGLKTAGCRGIIPLLGEFDGATPPQAPIGRREHFSGLVVIRVFSYHPSFMADGKAERLLSPTTMVAAGRRWAGFRAAGQSEFDPGE
jgi:hypothetical protein